MLAYPALFFFLGHSNMVSHSLFFEQEVYIFPPLLLFSSHTVNLNKDLTLSVIEAKPIQNSSSKAVRLQCMPLNPAKYTYMRLHPVFKIDEIMMQYNVSQSHIIL